MVIEKLTRSVVRRDNSTSCVEIAQDQRTARLNHKELAVDATNSSSRMRGINCLGLFRRLVRVDQGEQ